MVGCLINQFGLAKLALGLRLAKTVSFNRYLMLRSKLWQRILQYFNQNLPAVIALVFFISWLQFTIADNSVGSGPEILHFSATFWEQLESKV